MKTLLPLAFATFLLATFGAAADELGNAKRGHELAGKVCAECHAVEAGDLGDELPLPPGFQRLANDPAMTAIALRVFLTTPHTNMPNLILTDTEVDDVIAYIHSLKGS